MNVFEAVQTVLAIRSYEDKPIPEAIIERIVEAGRLTGSSMNRQPWHFIVIQDREMLQQLGKLAQSGPYIAQAPMAVAVVIERTRFAVSDGSRAIQSMMLTAWEEGIGSNWVGFMGFEDVKPLLAIPAEMDVLAILPFGYPTKSVGKGKKQRKARAEVIHYERWGG
jgi:nitroreductase